MFPGKDKSKLQFVYTKNKRKIDVNEFVNIFNGYTYLIMF